MSYIHIRRGIRPVLLFLLALLAGLAPKPVNAHPHCFIVNAVHFIFGQDGLDRIRIDWEFDTFFASQIMADCDGDGDDRLNPEEKDCIKKNYFDGLAEHNYFTFIQVDGQPVKKPEIEDLTITQIDYKVLYQFHIPCPVPAGAGSRTVRVSLYDPTFFCSMSFPDSLPILVANEGDLDFSHQVRVNKEISYYYGQFNPWEAVLEFCLPPCGGSRAVAASIEAEQISAQPVGPQARTDSRQDASPWPTVANPVHPNEENQTGPASAAEPDGLGFYDFILKKQRALYDRMAELAREVKGPDRTEPLLILIGIAFLYGMIHAAGPGHGKALAASFVLARGPKLKQALLFGNMIALFHGMSAVVLVAALKTALMAFTGQALDRVEYITKITSFSLITALGLFLMITSWKTGNKHNGKKKGPANIGIMALMIGLVPCPGVVLVLLFCLSLDMLGVGLLMALFQTLGMALTISLVTVLVTGGRQGGFKMLADNEKRMMMIEKYMETLAGLAVFLLGLFFLTGLNH